MSTPRKPAKKKAKAKPAPKKEAAVAVAPKKKPARKTTPKPVKKVEPQETVVPTELPQENQMAVLEYTLRNSQRMTTALEVTAAALTVADANGNPMLPQLVHAAYQTNQLIAGLIGQQYVPMAQYNQLADQYQKLYAAYQQLTQPQQQVAQQPYQTTVGGII